MCIHTGVTPVEGSVLFNPNQRIQSLICANICSGLLRQSVFLLFEVQRDSVPAGRVGGDYSLKALI